MNKIFLLFAFIICNIVIFISAKQYMIDKQFKTAQENFKQEYDNFSIERYEDILRNNN